MLFFLIPRSSFCQNGILTRNSNLAYIKCEVAALKITIEVFGDSVANELFMGKKYLPGPIFAHFDRKLNITKVVFREKFGEWDTNTKRKMTEAIKKTLFFLSSEDFRFLSDDSVKENFAVFGEESIIPFSCNGSYMLLIWNNRNKVLEEQCNETYKYIDFVKSIIEKYDQMEIEDLDGNVYRSVSIE